MSLRASNRAAELQSGIRSLLIDDGSERELRTHFQINEKGRGYLSFRANYNAGQAEGTRL